MSDHASDEQRIAESLRSQLDAAVRPFDPESIARRATQMGRTPGLPAALAAVATVAAAVALALVGTQLLGHAPSAGGDPQPKAGGLGATASPTSVWAGRSDVGLPASPRWVSAGRGIRRPDAGRRRLLKYNYLVESRRPAFEAARAACEQQIGPPPDVEPLSEAQIRNRYSDPLHASVLWIWAILLASPLMWTTSWPHGWPARLTRPSSANRTRRGHPSMTCRMGRWKALTLSVRKCQWRLSGVGQRRSD